MLSADSKCDECVNRQWMINARRQRFSFPHFYLAFFVIWESFDAGNRSDILRSLPINVNYRFHNRNHVICLPQNLFKFLNLKLWFYLLLAKTNWKIVECQSNEIKANILNKYMIRSAGISLATTPHILQHEMTNAKYIALFKSGMEWCIQYTIHWLDEYLVLVVVVARIPIGWLDKQALNCAILSCTSEKRLFERRSHTKIYTNRAIIIIIIKYGLKIEYKRMYKYIYTIIQTYNENDCCAVCTQYYCIIIIIIYYYATTLRR